MQPCQNYSWLPRAGRYQQTGAFLPLFHTSLSTRSELFAARNGSSSYPRCMRTESPGASETYGDFNDDDDSRCI